MWVGGLTEKTPLFTFLANFLTVGMGGKLFFLTFSGLSCVMQIHFEAFGKEIKVSNNKSKGKLTLDVQIKYQQYMARRQCNWLGSWH